MQLSRGSLPYEHQPRRPPSRLTRSRFRPTCSIGQADIDVVYQDFYYSFDPDLDFDQVAAFGFKSELPIVTPHNLLAFNSPHNAPMWRKSLHQELGLFDTSYRSAGDYEFWVRCMAGANHKRFGKINTPHVVYYQNPEGISTRPDTRGVEESSSHLEPLF